MSGKAKNGGFERQAGVLGQRAPDTSGAGKGLSAMKLLEHNHPVHRMDERIAEAERILFLMAEVVRKNFFLRVTREDRLLAAFCELAGGEDLSPVELQRISRMVRKELAKC